MNITIDPEFRDLIPPPQPAELEQLHKSLSAMGCYTPLIVWKGEDVLVDGHNRYEYCRDRDIEFTVIEKSFSSRDVAKNWIILNQLGRRNMHPDAMAILRGKLYNGRKKEHGDRGPEKIVQSEPSFSSTAETVAKETGVSAATVKRDAKFADAAEKLGITQDIVAGKEKRTRKEIVETAFPEAKKPKKEAPAPAEQENAEEEDIAPLIVDGTQESDDGWMAVVDAFMALSREHQEYAFNAINQLR